MSSSFSLDSTDSSPLAPSTIAVTSASIAVTTTVTVAPTLIATNPPPPPPPSQLPLAENEGGKENVGLIVGSVVVGVLLGILLAIGLWFCFCRRRQRRQNVPMQGTASSSDDVTMADEYAPPAYASMQQPQPIPASSSNNLFIARWLERMNSRSSTQSSTRPRRKDTQDSDTTSDSASVYSQSTFYSQNLNPFASTSTVVLTAPPAGYTGLPMVEEADERDTNQGSRNSRVSR